MITVFVLKKMVTIFKIFKIWKIIKYVFSIYINNFSFSHSFPPLAKISGNLPTTPALWPPPLVALRRISSTSRHLRRCLPSLRWPYGRLSLVLQNNILNTCTKWVYYICFLLNFFFKKKRKQKTVNISQQSISLWEV